jgi:hypothetical protein
MFSISDEQHRTPSMPFFRLRIWLVKSSTTIGLATPLLSVCISGAAGDGSLPGLMKIELRDITTHLWKFALLIFACFKVCTLLVLDFHSPKGIKNQGNTS